MNLWQPCLIWAIFFPGNYTVLSTKTSKEFEKKYNMKARGSRIHIQLETETCKAPLKLNEWTNEWRFNLACGYVDVDRLIYFFKKQYVEGIIYAHKM